MKKYKGFERMGYAYLKEDITFKGNTVLKGRKVTIKGFYPYVQNIGKGLYFAYCVTSDSLPLQCSIDQLTKEA